MKRNSQTTSSKRTKGATDFNRLRAVRDADIDFSDIPKLGKSFWKNARLAMPEAKDRLTIRVDHDIYSVVKEKWPWVPDAHQRHPALLHGSEVGSGTLAYSEAA